MHVSSLAPGARVDTGTLWSSGEGATDGLCFLEKCLAVTYTTLCNVLCC
jgi:hypothetical protein